MPGADLNPLADERVGRPANATRFLVMASYPEADSVPFRAAGKRLRERTGRVDAYRALAADVLRRIAAAGFPGAAVRDVAGMYEGRPEPGLQAEIIVSLQSDPDAWNRIYLMVEELALDWEQEEIWISHEPISLVKVKTS